MKDLVIFCFETGDTSVPYWQEFVLVDHEKMDYCTLAGVKSVDIVGNTTQHPHVRI